MSIPAAQLLLDLNLTFPALDARILLGGAEPFAGPVIAFSKQVPMQDGRPMILLPEDLRDAEPGPDYSEGVHTGFIAYAAARDWYVVAYVHGYLLVPAKSLVQAAVAVSHKYDAVKAWCDEHVVEGSVLHALVEGGA